MPQQGQTERVALVPVLFALASCSYAGSLTLGVLVGSRRVDSSGFHWLHHALYASTFALAAVTAGVALLAAPLGIRVARGDATVGWVLLPALVAFALIPFLGTRGRRHPVVGVVPVPLYLLALAALVAR